MTTLVTAAQLLQIRRMVAEPLTAIYTDALLTTMIEKYPLLDERGQQPYTFDSTVPPAQVPNPDWIPSYDLNAAAADIWEEKAAAVSDRVNFSADGGNYSMSNQYEQYMKNARHYRARRSAKTARSFKWPKEVVSNQDTGTPWIENNPEPYEEPNDVWPY
jgi:hypothetical protein